MLSRKPTSSIVVGFALVAIGLLAGCVAQPVERFDENLFTVQESSVRTGAALGLQKLEMQRALRDMAAFHQTMEGMIMRRDRGGFDAFSASVMTYFRSHLNPMLQTEWQSSHAELIDLDANLRVLEADVLAQMGQSQEMHRVLDDLQSRYEGRENLLVDFPIGEESPLGDAIELIKLRLDYCMWFRDGRMPTGGSDVPGAVSKSVCMGPA